MRIKCPHCNGKGFSEINSAVNMTCGWCMGQGELDLEIVPTEPQTEQEYIQTCNTEQLAEVLADVSLWIHPYMKQKNRFELLKKQFYGWLKQPHREE